MTDRISLPDLRGALQEEFASGRARVVASRALAGILPNYHMSRSRTRILRAIGWQIGPGSLLFGVPYVSGSKDIRDALSIGSSVFINIGCTFELSDRIIIQDNVSLGHEVMLLTSSHHVGSRNGRAGSHFVSPVTISQGAWIGTRATILPGVTVGEGAIVSSGSVVHRDVAPNTLVAGVPAVVTVRRLPG